MDAFVLIYWAKYLGKLNKTKVYEWEQKVKLLNDKGLNIKLIKVNLDYQKFWGIDQNDIPTFEL